MVDSPSDGGGRPSVSLTESYCTENVAVVSVVLPSNSNNDFVVVEDAANVVVEEDPTAAVGSLDPEARLVDEDEVVDDRPGSSVELASLDTSVVLESELSVEYLEGPDL